MGAAQGRNGRMRLAPGDALLLRERCSGTFLLLELQDGCSGSAIALCVSHPCSHHARLYPLWDMSCLIWSQLQLGDWFHKQNLRKAVPAEPLRKPAQGGMDKGER